MIKRTALVALLVTVISQAPVHAQSRFFAGGLGGVSTLSADGQTSVTPDSVAFSTYRAFNGPALNVFGGTHFSDYLSLQGNYVWNRNAMTVTSSFASTDSPAVGEEKRSSSQHSFILDLLLYFRNRESWVRPYLSVGSGIVRFKTRRQELLNLRGSPVQLPEEFTDSKSGLRVAVGVDVAIGRQFAVRYSFSETISGNPISSRLSPRGDRTLMNFQNLVGIVKYF